MRKFILIIISLSLLVTLALALTACPRTTEIQPEQGTVEPQPIQPSGTDTEQKLPEGAAITPDQLEEHEVAEEGAEAGDEEAGEPDGDEEAVPDDEEGADEEAGEAEDAEEETETE